MNAIRGLKITTLADNLVMTKCLGQWGLSLLLEFLDDNGENRKVMFDTGLHKDSLLYNLKQLEVDLSDLDCVVISHGHRDHTAATVEIVEASAGARVYAHPHTFLPRFYEDRTGKRRQHGVPKDEGLDEIEKAGGQVLLTADPTEIVPGVWTTGQIERSTPFEYPLPLSKEERSIIVVDGEESEDLVLDDQALWMNAKGIGVFVTTGCAHAGFVNTLLHIRKLVHSQSIYGLVGGTHLVGRPEAYLQQTINALRKLSLDLLSPCHCTGFKAMSRLYQEFPESFILNFSGRVIEAEKELSNRLM